MLNYLHNLFEVNTQRLTSNWKEIYIITSSNASNCVANSINHTQTEFL